MALGRNLFSARVRRETERRGETLIGRFGSQYVLDAIAWLIAVLVAGLLRFDLVVTEPGFWVQLAIVAVALIVVQLFVGWGFSLYRGRFSYGSFEEVRALLGSVLVTAAIVELGVVLFALVFLVPRSIVLIALPFAFVFMGAVRYIKRLFVEISHRPGSDAEPTLILGAGYIGSLLVGRMLTDRYSPYLPIGLLDDDPRLANRQVRGVPVMGARKDLARVARTTGAKVLIVAIARADAGLLREISDIAEATALQVKVLPPLEDLLTGPTVLSDVHDIAIEDLIGRQPVDTDVESIAEYLAGRRVLVTGAGGSIGSELSRQIAKFGPSELMLLDRDESGLQTTQISIAGHGLLDTREVILADIRDKAALTAIFTERRPEVVFHAAALKHLPMLEQYPEEAWKTNVVGTLNVIEAARAAGVTTFVNISTDKAANPISVLGHSKRVAEKLTAWASSDGEARFLSVRFGNVIGSRGSMLPTFTALIEAGGPLTVTHPDATRYFMTIPEACQLVMQAGAIGEPGEVLILDMGEPVRILDVAERMIAASGKDIDIVFTGLRNGEKLHEELVGYGERGAHPKHPKITHARVLALSPDRLDKREWHRRLTSESRSREPLLPEATDVGGLA